MQEFPNYEACASHAKKNERLWMLIAILAVLVAVVAATGCGSAQEKAPDHEWHATMLLSSVSRDAKTGDLVTSRSLAIAAGEHGHLIGEVHLGLHGAMTAAGDTTGGLKVDRTKNDVTTLGLPVSIGLGSGIGAALGTVASPGPGTIAGGAAGAVVGALMGK